MKNLIKALGLAMIFSFLLTGCDSVLHNGTEMAINSVKVTGLPVSTFGGKTLVFSYLGTSKWIHDDATLFADPIYRADVDANGDWMVTFNPPLSVTTPELKFLLISPGLEWKIIHVAKGVGAKADLNDVKFENTWAGALSPVDLVGVVNGELVDWTME